MMSISSWLCSSIGTAQPGGRTTDPRIAMPERYESSLRVDSLTRVVNTPVRHIHTRQHLSEATFKMNERKYVGSKFWNKPSTLMTILPNNVN